MDGVRHHGRRGVDGAQEPDELFNFPAVEFGLVAKNPLLLARHVARVNKPGHIPKVLAVMK
jgi:hypothetical protein